MSIDLLILTETRWKYCSEWSGGLWIHLHSGNAAQPGAGILVLISKQVCTSDAVRWTEILSGRIVRVQIRMPQTCFDVVAKYQYTIAPTQPRQEERLRGWSTLPKTTCFFFVFHKRLFFCSSQAISIAAWPCDLHDGQTGLRTLSQSR